MTLFRAFLAALLIIMLIYTSIAVFNEGWNLIPAFFGNIADLTWTGQFNLDFLTYLILSGLWVAWRGGFTGSAIGLGLAASTLGMLFMAPYLLLLLNSKDGDIRRVLLGVRAAEDTR